MASQTSNGLFYLSDKHYQSTNLDIFFIFEGLPGQLPSLHLTGSLVGTVI